MVNESFRNVSSYLSDFFGDVEAEDVTFFLTIPKTDCLLLLAKISIFEVIGKEVGNNLLFWVAVNVHIFEDSGRVTNALFVLNNDVNLCDGINTVAGTQDLSMMS